MHAAAPTAAAPTAANYPRRVIIHLDLDCFYCQVEQKRCSIPRDTPCAVQQWNGLIAVNYAARAAGITRHMRVAEAKKLVSELQLVHVQTIGNVHEHQQQPSDGAQEVAPAQPSATAAGVDGSGVDGSALDRGSAKACLNRYRRASAEIMALLAEQCPGCPLEKASIDEAYLDITSMVARELAAAEGGASDGGSEVTGVGGLPSLMAAATAASVVLGEGGLRPDMSYDRLAAAGAVVAARLRRQLLEVLDFTASAGIAHNKLLAKIASALHKPNQQTVVLPRAVNDLMKDLPLGKVKGLGGKLGARLEQLGAATAGAAAALSWEVLLAQFDSKARWLHNTVRGVDDEPVIPRDKVKSLTSAKSFAATSDIPTCHQWLAVLAAELAERLEEDSADHHRVARSLVLQYRGGDKTGSRDSGQSIRGPMPPAACAGTVRVESVTAAAVALFNKIKWPPLPLNRLSITATDFVDCSGQGSGAAMARFLAAGNEAQKQRPQQQQGLASGPLSTGTAQLEHPQPVSSSIKHKNSNQPTQMQLFLQSRDRPAPHEDAVQGCQMPASPASIHHAAATATSATSAPAAAPEATLTAMPATTLVVAAAALEAAGTAAAGSTATGSAAGGKLSMLGACSDQQVAAGVDAGNREAIAGVDIAEQARILRDFELRQLQQRSAGMKRKGAESFSGKAGKKGGGKKPVVDGKQLSITALLGKRS